MVKSMTMVRTDRLEKELASLPVAAVAEPLNEALRKEASVIVTAAPGAGSQRCCP